MTSVSPDGRPGPAAAADPARGRPDRQDPSDDPPQAARRVPDHRRAPPGDGHHEHPGDPADERAGARPDRAQRPERPGAAGDLRRHVAEPLPGDGADHVRRLVERQDRDRQEQLHRRTSTASTRSAGRACIESVERMRAINERYAEAGAEVLSLYQAGEFDRALDLHLSAEHEISHEHRRRAQPVDHGHRAARRRERREPRVAAPVPAVRRRDLLGR